MTSAFEQSKQIRAHVNNMNTNKELTKLAINPLSASVALIWSKSIDWFLPLA